MEMQNKKILMIVDCNKYFLSQMICIRVSVFYKDRSYQLRDGVENILIFFIFFYFFLFSEAAADETYEIENLTFEMAYEQVTSVIILILIALFIHFSKQMAKICQHGLKPL